jgi:hypothetical protein
MELPQKIVTLNSFRILSLVLMMFGLAIFILSLILVTTGMTIGWLVVGSFVVVVAAFFGRRYCVRELERIQKETPEQEVKEAAKQGFQTYKYNMTAGFIGAFVGFLLRPAVPLVGQLPLSVVLTRGANLQGMDTLLVPAAQTSFNYVLVGSIIGGVIGHFATKLVAKK